MKSRTGEEDYEFSVRIEPPGIHEQTMRNSEEQFFQKLKDEIRRGKAGVARVYFRADGRASADQIKQAIEDVFAAEMLVLLHFAHFPGNSQQCGDIDIRKSSVHRAMLGRRRSRAR